MKDLCLIKIYHPHPKKNLNYGLKKKRNIKDKILPILTWLRSVIKLHSKKNPKKSVGYLPWKFFRRGKNINMINKKYSPGTGD